MSSRLERCPWAGDSDPLMLAYHDEEWGVPQHDDRVLFEMLLLEGAQAGLSWSTVLQRREGYRRAFAGFDPEIVARFSARDEARLLADPGIIRNRLKVSAAITNARAFLQLVEAHGSFAAFLWEFVDSRPRVNRFRRQAEVPSESETSRRLSATLRERGFRFVGPTIVYAYMQAVGMVNDHLVDCFRHAQIQNQT